MLCGGLFLLRLVASSAKVEAQVQLLQRRCVQYGLQLTPFPQSTISRNLFLNPVSVYPSPICVNMRCVINCVWYSRIHIKSIVFIDLLSFTQFVVPPIVCIRHKPTADLIDERLLANSFVEDGIFLTDPQFLACIDNFDEFDFLRSRTGKVRHISGRQYVHQSGAFFIRNMRDRQGWAILVGIENSRVASRDGFTETVRSILREIHEIAAVPSE